jgi:hypothetical protein
MLDGLLEVNISRANSDVRVRSVVVRPVDTQVIGLR